MVEYVYRVPDVSCQHCVAAITREVGKIEGVQKVDVNLDEKIVSVRADPSVDERLIRAGIDEAGFDIAA